MQAIKCKSVAAHTKDMTFVVYGKTNLNRKFEFRVAPRLNPLQVFNVGDTTLINRNDGWKTEADA